MRSVESRIHLKALAFICLVKLGFGELAFGAATNISSVSDTTLSENYSSNNFGAMLFANAGTTQNFTRNRALFKFDIRSAIPPNSKITSADLILEVTHVPADGYSFSDFGLHRVLQSWGEGNKLTPTNGAGGAGTGAPATTNEATWFYRFAFTTNTWSTPGASSPTDFAAASSSVQTIYGLADSPYTFANSTQMVADVQSWLDRPQSNFGWILVCQDEGSPFTARRFGTHEDTNFAPQLEIEYTIAPVVERVQKSGSQLNLYFTAQAGQSYSVECRDTLGSGSWQTFVDLGYYSDVTPVLVIDPLTRPQRFYRIATH
jgi:hypothetical protein